MPAAPDLTATDLITNIDKKILFELDCDSRQSLSQLAKKLKQGRDKIEYRIERMTELGIIRRFSATINFYRLGFTIFKTYFRLRSNKKRVKEFHNFLANKPYVYRVALCAGTWDVNLGTAARSAREFHAYHIEILSKFHDIILDCAMYTVIDVWRYRKGYLVGQQTPGLLTGGEVGTEKLDKIEYGILKALAQDARISNVVLADRLNTTPAVIKYRIEQLEARKIIVGYRVDVDHEKLGLLYFKTQLFLSSYQESTVKKLQSFVEATPPISHFISQLGDCPFEIELQVPSLVFYHEIIDKLREDFPTLIENVQSMLIYKEIFQWFPHQEDLK